MRYHFLLSIPDEIEFKIGSKDELTLTLASGVANSMQHSELRLLKNRLK